MQVEIRSAGTCAVRVVDVQPRVLTLRTLDGHMEAGRISFGAYLENKTGENGKPSFAFARGRAAPADGTMPRIWFWVMAFKPNCGKFSWRALPSAAAKKTRR